MTPRGPGLLSLLTMADAKHSLSTRIAAGMVLGLAAGLLLGKSAAPLGELGKLVITLIKAAATPLLFLAILNAVLRTEVSARAAGRMVGVALLNASVALALGLLLSNLLQPGRHLAAGTAASAAAGAAAPMTQRIDLLKSAAGFVPASFVEPFVKNEIIPIVVVALLLGFGLRRARGAEAQAAAGALLVEKGAAGLLAVMETILGWIVQLVPLAVFGVVAKACGEHGLAPLKGLAVYVAVGLGGLALHALVTYQLWLVGYVKLSLRRFWEEAKEPVVYSIGANSSLATLPLTLKALDNLGVSKQSSTLGACVGTNLNNDGIILYEAMAVLFVAQAHGLDLSLGQQILAAFFCMVAAVGIAGVPEAGFVSLSLVLTTVGLPTELLPLLLTVDWIIARARSVVNVLSDMMVSIILDRLDGRDFAEGPAPATAGAA